MRPLILVTNDDGIVAPGIRALVEVASRYGDVVVVAPDSPQSAQGHAVTLSKPLRLNKVKLFSPEVEAWECSGTPVDCVKIAQGVVLRGRKPDLCVSGINHGSNVSINILYSGTMSAAMEASLESVPSIGFSLCNYEFNADFTAAQHFADILIRRVLEEKSLPGCHLLNVNIPALPLDQIKGMRVCRQAQARWIEEFVEGKDPSGRKYYWLSGKFVNEDPHADADTTALDEGYVSIVPSHHDLTDHQARNPLKVMLGL